MKKYLSMIVAAAMIAFGVATASRAQTTDGSKYYSPNVQTQNTLIIVTTTTLATTTTLSFSTGTPLAIANSSTGALYAVGVSTGIGPGACAFVSFSSVTAPTSSAKLFGPCNL